MIRAAFTLFLLGTILGFMIAVKMLEYKPTIHQVLLSTIKLIDNSYQFRFILSFNKIFK